MPNRLHLAAILLTAALPLHAQVRDELPTQIQSPTLDLHRKPKPADLSWTWQYTEPAPNGRERALLQDPRLKPLLTATLTAPQSFWGDTAVLPSTVETALAFLATPGRVIGEGNRYVTAEGAVPDFPASRGQLFLDLNPGRPLVVFSAIDWIRDSRSTDEPGAEYTLWVFPSRALDPDHIPTAFHGSISRWTSAPPTGSQLVGNITHVILVDPDGQPHAVSPAAVGAHNTSPTETPDTKAHS